MRDLTKKVFLFHSFHSVMRCTKPTALSFSWMDIPPLLVSMLSWYVERVNLGFSSSCLRPCRLRRSVHFSYASVGFFVEAPILGFLRFASSFVGFNVFFLHKTRQSWVSFASLTAVRLRLFVSSRLVSAPGFFAISFTPTSVPGFLCSAYACVHSSGAPPVTLSTFHYRSFDQLPAPLKNLGCHS